jgi:hypothetical protein
MIPFKTPQYPTFLFSAVSSHLHVAARSAAARRFRRGQDESRSEHLSLSLIHLQSSDASSSPAPYSHSIVAGGFDETS